MDIYDGGWKNGFATGFGKFTTADNHVYQGGWWAGPPYGHGVAISPSGEKQGILFLDDDERFSLTGEPVPEGKCS